MTEEKKKAPEVVEPTAEEATPKKKSKNEEFHEAFKKAFAAGLNEDAEENGHE